MRRTITLVSILVVVLATSLFTLISPTHAQDASGTTSACENVTYLMERNITPYDMSLSGGILRSGGAESGTLGAGAYADFWSFTLTRPRNQNNIIQDLPVTISFSNVSGSPLEFALYNGLFPAVDYQPLVVGDFPFSPSAETSAYTLVVRKVNLSDESAGNYTLTVTSDGMGTPSLALRNEETNLDFSPAPEVSNGVLRIAAPAAEIFIHPDGTRRVHPRGGNSTQVFMPNERYDFSAHTINIGNWATKLSFLGGDLAAVGADRVYFHESFDPRVTISGVSPAELNLQNVTYGDGTIIRTDWADVFGIWVMDDCTGFKLKDGRTFTAETPATGREIRAEGTLDAFTLITNAITPNGTSRHTALLNWATVRENSQVTLRNGVYHVDLLADREIELQSTDFIYASPASDGEIAPAVITLNDQTVAIALDWLNMRYFSLRDALITFEFLDAPRGTTTRDGLNISSITAQNDVIQLIYKEVNGQAGEQRLMLPASDSYLEIVTPAGDPVFDGTARAGTSGYFPRALNNTGGDCYPTNTAIPEANCPTAGHINPANGNIWLAMTDAVAYGDRLSLDVTRHYNSAYALLDSPFGKGWSTPYLLDYNVLFDQATNSRTVTPVTVSQFAIGLDITYAPRGIATFITQTGSRHQFVGTGDGITADMRSLTMPGWRLIKASLTDNWRLTQDNGLEYEFDRAGRLIRYGYPHYGRVMSIAYPRTNLNGASEIGENAVIITDHLGDFAPRQLELYYDAEHRIIKTILRDMTIGADESTCDLADNCVQTTYTYQNGLLTGVTYADGQTATYAYDEFGRLIGFDDPRAPISQRMNFVYNEIGEVISSEIVQADANTVYELSNPATSGNTRTATITDRLQNVVTYTYTLNAGDLRAVGTSYQLTQKTSPLAGTGDRLEDQPTVYRWGEGLQAGFLVRVEARVSTSNQGRNSYDYIYTPNGQLQCVACAFSGLPELEIIYDQPIELRANVFRPTSVTYADGTTEQFEYDANGLLTRYIDRDGADYSLTWSETAPFSVTRMTRANDGVVWDYFYNPVGLVVSLVQTNPNDTLPYQVSYQWDGLGRLIGVTDGVLGRYVIEYPAPTADENGLITSQIRLTDPVGGVTVSIFDGRNQLIETRVEQAETIIRKTTRSYDVLGRETETTEWVGAIGTEELLPYTTTTAYTPTPSMNLADATEQIVRGESVIITDPYGRTSTTIYDALGRIRRAIDSNGIINDYSYNANTVDNTTLTFGLQITQQTILQGTPFTNRADYFFDARRQLRAVRVGVRDNDGTQPIFQEWQFAMNGDTTRLRLLNTTVGNQAFGVREITWGDYVAGQPPSVSLSQANLPLNSAYNVETGHRATFGVNYDFMGRTTQIADATTTTQIIYCPIITGGTKALYGTAPSCDEGSNYDLSLSYDVHGRLIEAIDQDGRRVISYTPNLAGGAWDVSIAFSSNTGEAVWAMQFNPLGAVTSWTDENGLVHTYEYDTRGRLLTSVVADNPEASQYFRYNAADQLLEQSDGLGRGYLYNYDVLGRVVSKVDLKTADAISYSYTPTGLLSAVTASDGSTTVYVYEDRSNPNRLTRIIEPTGAQHRFEWSDANPNDLLLVNALIYTDPFNNRTVYRYDGTGLLWRVDEPLPRSSEILYDDAGNITDWLRNSISASSVSSKINIARPAPSAWTISDTTPNGTGWSSDLFFVNDRLAGVGAMRFGYDALGRLVSATDNDDVAWALGWNSPSTVTVTDAIGGSATLQYDALHRLISQDVNGQVLGYTYTIGDGDVPVMTVNHPVYGVREYVFSAGNARTGESPTVFLRAYGQETSYSYDGEGRLKEVITRACSDVTYANLFDCITDDVPLYETHALITYNAIGLPIRISDQDGNLETFAYDDGGRLIGYQNANGRNFAYRYDSAGRLVTLTTATGVKLIMNYTPLNTIAGICRTRASASDVYADCVSAGGELETYTYDSLGRLSNRAYDGASIRYQYDGDGNLTNAGDVVYEYSPLGLLTSMSISGGAEYGFTYADLNTLATAGDTTFTYDAFGDVIGQNDRVTNATFAYDLATQTYTITDGSSRLSYLLDGRGYLSQLLFNDNPLFDVDYLSLQSAVDVLWADDTLVAYTLNNQRETDNLLFSGANEMSIYYDLSGTGKTLRQNIILPFANGGYVAIYGYDADERPLTMRITDFQGFAVLFSQSITYNALGLRESEAWQYADSTQLISRYAYDGERLIERRVNLLGSTPTTWVFEYDYDENGNMTAITETTTATVCAQLSYDNANRLVSIDKNDAQTNLLYDAYGRLVRAGDVRLSYRGADSSPYAMLVNSNPVYFGAVEGQPAQFQVGRGGDVTWLINDGRNRTLLPYQTDDDPSNEVWLFDALGRYVPISTPAFDNPCQINGLPANLSPELAIQPLRDGALWLAQTGLYIQNGRAYDIETGLFAQRAPHLDALGNAYESGENNIIPYPISTQSAEGNGLRLLRDAMLANQLNSSLSAQAVLSAVVPQIGAHTSPLATAYREARQPLAHTLANLLALPEWLETQYNMPNAYRDEDGYLRLPLQDAPAQGGYDGNFINPFLTDLPQWNQLVMTAIQPADAVLSGLMDDLRPLTPMSSYQPTAQFTPLLVQSWRMDNQSRIITADDVLAWLPTPLANPAQGAYALDFGALVSDVWEKSEAEWVAETLTNHLPSLPALPPMNLGDWRATVFTDDVFNPLAGYGDVLPNLPSLPAYRWGANEDWLGVGR